MPTSRRVPARATPAWLTRLVVVTALVGVGAGVGGGLVYLGLHTIQHLAFGYSEGTFLEGLLDAPPVNRVVALVLAGILGGVGWFFLRRWGRRSTGRAIVSVEAAVGGAGCPPSSRSSMRRSR
ncbi:hypothetical protein ACRAWC_17960 [Leifsonia sp. L25]|uniref:hypothetical protein n=1 Tax=Leifsonia sp. L25 TaxID=3423957 RepID=UPI003D693524